MPGRDRRELGAIFAGGVVGAVLRVALLQTHAGAAPGWPWVTTATIGSYTTFSTWMLESQRLVEDGELALAAGNVLLSLGAGLGAVALGRFIGAHL